MEPEDDPTTLLRKFTDIQEAAKKRRLAGSNIQLLNSLTQFREHELRQKMDRIVREPGQAPEDIDLVEDAVKTYIERRNDVYLISMRKHVSNLMQGIDNHEETFMQILEPNEAEIKADLQSTEPESIIRSERWLVERFNNWAVYVFDGNCAPRVFLKAPCSESLYGHDEQIRYTFTAYDLPNFEALFKDFQLFYPSAMDQQMMKFLDHWDAKDEDSRENFIKFSPPQILKYFKKFTAARNRKMKARIMAENQYPDDETKWPPLPKSLMDYTSEDLRNKLEWQFDFGSFGKMWMQSRFKRTASHAIFNPKCSYMSDVLNTFEGFAIERSNVLSELQPETRRDLSRFLSHIYGVWCGFDPKLFAYFLKHEAFILQKRTKTETLIGVLGDEGIGKTFYMHIFGGVIGRRYTKIVKDTRELGSGSSPWNEVLEGAILLALDDVDISGALVGELLKTNITDRNVTIKRKFRDPKEMPSDVNFYVFTNSEKNLMNCTQKSRRYLLLEGCISRILELYGESKDTYFENMLGKRDTLQEKKRTKNIQLAYAELLYRIKLDDFSPQEIPTTKLVFEQRIRSQAKEFPIRDWWLKLIAQDQYEVTPQQGPNNTLITSKAWDPQCTEMYWSTFEFLYNNAFNRETLGAKAKKIEPATEALRQLESMLVPVPQGQTRISETYFGEAVIKKIYIGTITQARAKANDFMPGANILWASAEEKLQYDKAYLSRNVTRDTLDNNYLHADWFMIRNGLLKVGDLTKLDIPIDDEEVAHLLITHPEMPRNKLSRYKETTSNLF